MLINRVIPVYPILANRPTFSFTVHLLGEVGTEDHPILQLERPSLLILAALDAVRQWFYTPTGSTGAVGSDGSQHRFLRADR